MSERAPEAVLWDMDGTLADTEPHWIRAQSALLTRRGLPELTPQQEIDLVGASSEQVVTLFQSLGVIDDFEEIVDEVFADVCDSVTDNIQWRPGAVELLADLNRHGVPTALVTNSNRALADAVLKHLPGCEFTLTVTSSDVRPGKPEPDPFYYAAERLGVAVTDCVVIEDSMNGIRGALAADCVTIAVPHGIDIPPSPEYILRESLVGLNWPQLRALYTTFRTRGVPTE
ncbi:HAD family hydrolase [Gulosibacter sediminis]|uniref:HAD family hydrolase n=1 Tax=Gulosibacter sediminis TaxID=1729695 RepID=UPI0024AD7CD0|nr:HAD family phosphatase [Gulosibacter sediminis]